jgi:uncharacterized protein (DUF427 family)
MEVPMKYQATWNGKVIAVSENTVMLEGNFYFPPEDVKQEYLEASTKTYTCPWKGTAAYYDVVVDGDRNAGSAWYYPTPSEAAGAIKGRIAFQYGIQVEQI